MKKNQKNSTGILLVAVQTEKNQKQKRIENFIDGLLVWIFAMLTGIAVCNMFGIKVNALPAIAGIAFAVYLSFEAEWKGNLKKYAPLAEVLVLILVLLLFHKTILDGWNLFLNQILDEIKQHLPYIYPQYPVSDGGLSDKWKLSVTMAVLVVVIEKISTVFIKMENRWITGLIGLMWARMWSIVCFQCCIFRCIVIDMVSDASKRGNRKQRKCLKNRKCLFYSRYDFVCNTYFHAACARKRILQK